MTPIASPSAGQPPCGPVDDPAITLVRLDPTEIARLRAVRLRALGEAPLAFSTTAAEAATWAPETWASQLATLATWVAVRDAGDVGMVRGRVDETDRTVAWLQSLWVAPEARGRGVARRLVTTVASWARAQACALLVLDVADDNHAALACYRALGFVATDHSEALPPPRADVLERRLALRLTSPAPPAADVSGGSAVGL